MKKIGFIGIGVMGKSMVLNLMKRGFEVSVYTRTKSKASEVIEKGAKWCDSLKDCVAQADAVITMVGFPKDVEEVYFGEDGILNNKTRKLCHRHDHGSPKLARIYREAFQKEFITGCPRLRSDVAHKRGPWL